MTRTALWPFAVAITTPQRKSVEVLRVLVAALVAVTLSSCDQSPLSKENIKRSLINRAERNKQPLLIESISDVEPMTLHGEKCSTVVAYVKGPLGVSMPIYFVCKQGHKDYISGGGDVLNEIDKEGYQAVWARVPKENSSDSSEAPTLQTAASTTPASTPDIRPALADDDASDLSHCSDDDLTVIAELAAKSYLKKRPRIYSDEDRDLSIKLGMQHDLVGDSLFRYRTEWLETIIALSKTLPGQEVPEPAATPSRETVETVAPTPVVETTSERIPRETPSASVGVAAALTPHSGALELKDAEEDLDRAWKALTAEQRDRLRQDEEKWRKNQDALPIEARMKSTAKRARYIWSLVERTLDD